MGLRHILESDPGIQSVTESCNHQDLIMNHTDSDIDIILADVNIDDNATFDCLQKFKQQRPDVKIIIFSSCANKEAIMKSLEIGVQGFHDKTAEPKEIIRAIHTVHSGGNSLASCVTTALVNHISTRQREYTANLSQREEEVLELVAKGKSNSDIADQLYISVRTVKFHISSIFAKLQVKNRTEAAALWGN
jgi:DNA-binding NarL/FixJ family response regulator